MPRSPLGVVEYPRYQWQLAWWLPDEGEYGGFLGDCDLTTFNQYCCMRDEEIRCLPDKDSREEAFFCREAAGLQSRGERTLYWDSEQDAKEALRQLLARWKVFCDGTEWPQWAKTALEAGWKPPKGWTP